VSDGDTPFAPTPSRRRRARQVGNVARSTELSSVAAFGCATLAGCASVPLGVHALVFAVRATAAEPRTFVAAPAFAVAAGAALAPAAAAAFGGAAAAVAQAGGLHLSPVTFDPKRLDAIGGLRRMFGFEAAIGGIRAAGAFGITLAALIPIGGDVLAAGTALGSPAIAAHVAAAGALRACVAACAVGACFAAADYALARRRWLRGLKMSFEELKRDAKENDGDPQMRARRKTLHRDLVRGAVTRTREASFVVVNPTHVAVALRYAPPQVPVPEVLVRAAGAGALRVRALAREARIPVIEDAPLARLLYATTLGSRTIAPETYVAVAQIVADLVHAGLLS
jgi:flagellar biosynthesis protein FlhB